MSGGRYFQGGLVGELGYTIEGSIGFNFFSGERATFLTVGPMMYMGAPHGVSNGNYMSGSLVYGATNMESLKGLTQYKGQTIAVDGVGEVGYSTLNGKSVNIDGTPFVDERSGKQVTTRTVVASGGINAVPNLFDAGLVSGTTYTVMTGFLHDFVPWWPLQ